MKKYTYIIFIITFVCLMIPSVCQAATLQWSYIIGTTSVGTNYYVDQIVADGKGGCIAVWTMHDPIPHDDIYIARFDKKGNKLWEKSFTRRNVKISDCDKKKVVFTISPTGPGSGSTYVVDKKGVLKEVYSTTIMMNDKIGPAGDKKGFFVQSDHYGIYGDIAIIRYSYK